jgi:2-oxo-4-hydroxy-4-carboxy-5-ureidoimidazoline decarboxylase
MRLNAAYRAQFGFPSILAVKGATADDVLSAIARRVDAAPEDEWTEALTQVARIARGRLDGIVQ